MAPRSFYERVVPNQFANVGFVWTSVNYLEHELPSADPMKDLRQWKANRLARSAAMARGDLLRFLALREWEIRPGGAFVCALAARSCRQSSDVRPHQSGPLGPVACSGRLHQSPDPRMVQRRADPGSGTRTGQDKWAVEACFEKTVVHPAVYTLPQGERPADAEAISEAYAKAVVGNLVAAFSPYILKGLRSERPSQTSFDNVETEEEARIVDNLSRATKEALRILAMHL
ncbi:hypothetical protein VTN77DRAFT_1011 [Rasamsonia byssochlamydoides]|uniref:uncharacterized protein n=1 Tax=Rasamsonia byssochlamydoides TaxID=89139 RepID=UPI0037436DAF